MSSEDNGEENADPLDDRMSTLFESEDAEEWDISDVREGNTDVDTSPTSETLETEETEETEPTMETDTQSSSDVGESQPSKLVRETEEVKFLIPPDVKEEFELTEDEIGLQFRREHGRKMEKHRDFRTAVARLVIENRGLVRQELGLE